MIKYVYQYTQTSGSLIFGLLSPPKGDLTRLRYNLRGSFNNNPILTSEIFRLMDGTATNTFRLEFIYD